MVVALIRRLSSAALVVIGVSLCTFFIARVIPGDPAALIAGPMATEAELERLRSTLGLDRPLWEQYWTYATAAAQGDFGTSLVTGTPVLEELFARMPATLELMAAATLLGIFGGIVLGVLAALNRDRAVDHAVRAGAVVAISMPGFWLGVLLLLVFYGLLGWAPGPGRSSLAPLGPTGFLTLDALLHGDFERLADALAHLALPAITLALADIGGLARLVRAAMITALQEEHVRTARASGTPERVVVWTIALRNALVPFIGMAGVLIAQMLYGAVATETIFAWPGMGRYVVQAIFDLDFPVIMGFTLLVSLVYVASNALADLAYRSADPRLDAKA